VLLSLTSLAGSQAEDPFGLWASRTRTQPGLVAITGSTDGRPYQLAGTVPAPLRPGLACPGAVSSTVASTVLPGTAGGLDRAACRAALVRCV
jgi:hypothetical protein